LRAIFNQIRAINEVLRMVVEIVGNSFRGIVGKFDR
jgi:hypothetical protein